MKVVTILDVDNESTPELLRLDQPLIHFVPWPFEDDAVYTQSPAFIDDDGVLVEDFPGTNAAVMRAGFEYLGVTNKGRWVPVSAAYVNELQKAEVKRL